jgi:phosphoribosylaminoimidazole-succinocarboxamide synthase
MTTTGNTHTLDPGQLMSEGKAQRLYATDHPDHAVVHYTDQATAFNGAKRAEIANKGTLNNAISARFMQLLGERGIPTHFLEQLDERSQLVRLVEIVPLEVVTRNVVAGSLVRRTGLPSGTKLASPIVELYYKRDDLGDPLLNDEHIAALEIATPDTVEQLRTAARAINDILTEELAAVGILLVDFKLEFGFTSDGELVLADEISPDTCRFWDIATGNVLDKDLFRKDMGGLEEAYTELLERLPAPRGAEATA